MFANLFQKKRGNWKDDALAGLTTALALVPGSIAFAFVAGVPPIAGLYAGFFVCMITAAFGGRPGMISSAAGSVAVVMVALVAEGNKRGGPGAGFEYLLLAVILMGAIQILVGVLRLGRLIRLVPHPVMMGFVNGLAIVVFLSQLKMFREREGAVVGDWLHGSALWTMCGLVALTMAIVYILPRFTKKIPSSLVAIVVVSLVAAFGISTQTVGDLSSVQGKLPMPHLPGVPLNWETFQFVIPYAIILAMVGLVETLMTLQLIDELTESRGKGNRECVALGAANIVAGIFKGMGGCALVGESLINIGSGGRGRMSGVIAASALLTFILVGAPLIDRIPIAALTGVMFVVVIATFEWTSFKTIGKVPFTDVLVIIAVTAITVWEDLAIAVLSGVVLSALVFAWKSAKHVQLSVVGDKEDERIYRLEGLLYFGSVKEFAEKFLPSADPQRVVLDFHDARVCDMSGLEAIKALGERYSKLGKSLELRHLSPDCRRMLDRASGLVEFSIADDDPVYLVARIPHGSVGTK
ncbi:SulP family inorganic anion transporter [Luteolibacter pohnpeiensis]|uniref:SulP family inorganic anion transporter n=1 Tax=Luteolibacter pohnpeiensis TaxID=454153 RepID=A0A934S6X2_9BACT|nr:SulP family inorganic anion transporter [Luteolibacter pohnpeiensis]MBK1881911.1 SulP family inorganic anion transporter [Luteolibacter pohnpeiensis]